MNKNIIVLIVLVLILFALLYFYAWPQWKKFHPKPAQPPAGAGMVPGGMPADPGQ